MEVKILDTPATVEFDDLDWEENFENALDVLQNDVKEASQKRKGQQLRESDIIRSDCEIFDKFFDNVFGEGAANAIFDGKMNQTSRIKAIDQLVAAKEKSIAERVSLTENVVARMNNLSMKGNGNKNREQRRAEIKELKAKKKFYEAGTGEK